jgi:hypothetical protein
VLCLWDGDQFVPLARFKALCDRQFAVGEEYPLEVVENRSMAGHRGFMASVAEGWANLSEENAPRFPEPGAPAQMGARAVWLCLAGGDGAG